MPFADGAGDQAGDAGEASTSGLSDPLETVLWQFLRFWPSVGTSLCAASTQPHILQIKATRPNGTTLSVDEIAAIGVQIAFHDGTIQSWLDMEPDTLRNENAQEGSPWAYFVIWLGPDANVSLVDGAYLVTARTATSPRAAENLPLLTIDPPF